MNPAAQRYRELAGALVAAQRRQASATAAAHSSHTEGLAAVEHDLAAAEEAVAQASAEVTRAQRFVAQTDLLAVSLWDELKTVRGRRGRRLGPLPAPADQSTLDAATALERAAARIDRARRGGGTPPPRVLPLLFLLGAVAAGLVATVAARVAWPLLLAAPVSGLLAARWWVDRRYDARLDPGGVGLVILGGLLSTAATWLNLR